MSDFILEEIAIDGVTVGIFNPDLARETIAALELEVKDIQQQLLTPNLGRFPMQERLEWEVRARTALRYRRRELAAAKLKLQAYNREHNEQARLAKEAKGEKRSPNIFEGPEPRWRECADIVSMEDHVLDAKYKRVSSVVAFLQHEFEENRAVLMQLTDEKKRRKELASNAASTV